MRGLGSVLISICAIRGCFNKSIRNGTRSDSSLLLTSPSFKICQTISRAQLVPGRNKESNCYAIVKIRCQRDVQGGKRGGGVGPNPPPPGYFQVVGYWLHWMGSHFHDRVDCNRITFSSIFKRVTRMGSQFLGALRLRTLFAQKWLSWGLYLAKK